MESYNFLYVNTLVQDYLKYICQEAQLAAAPNRVAEVLRKAGSSAQKEVESNLRPYVDSLEIHSVEEANDIFNQVMENEFADGTINWGRILTIFLFGGILAKKLQGPLAKENLRQISYFITDYIMGTKGKWISDNGGWDNGFITKFEDKSSWISLSTLKTKLLAVFSLFNQYHS
ncbi:bcl-2-related protein A1 [Protobothrops mucrosquamatus]|uniref:bcl-2-related protein A1 n=1 Tax=Protobothrops mucrosquamatus TaxID=103944 RepID=UPI0007756C75|nr:bcl-2-related protein A1 [Protobothrops mucrosquamatus]